MKLCRKCGLTKPLDTEHWWRNRKGRDGFHHICKVCAVAQQRLWKSVEWSHTHGEIANATAKQLDDAMKDARAYLAKRDALRAILRAQGAP